MKNFFVRRCLKVITSLTLSLSLALMPALGFAAPTGGTVAEGTATISTPDAVTTQINQTSQSATLDWQSFDVAADEIVRFIAPNENGVTLNRINDVDASDILGQIDANGKIFLINPNGIVFAEGSRVDVGGLVATTSQLSGFDPMTNTYQFQGTSSDASVINNGTITAADQGLIALVAPTVQNNGTLTARLGRVTLQGGENFTLDLYGDKLISLSADSELAQSLVENSGAIHADGGTIRLSAGQASDALRNVVNMGGYAEANMVNTENGRIILSADGGAVTFTGSAVAENGDIRIGGGWQGHEAAFADVENAHQTFVSGDIDVSGQGDNSAGTAVVWADKTTVFTGNIQARGGAFGGDGGQVEVSGKETLVFQGDVDTSAPQGETGNLLLDPINITITDGGSGTDDAEVTDGSVLVSDVPAGSLVISENALESLAAATNVSLQASNDITINDLTDNELSLTTTNNVVFSADADLDGSGAFGMDASDVISTQGAHVTISGDTVNVAGINTTGNAGGNITLFTTGSGAITMNGDLSTLQGDVLVNADTVLAGNIAVSTGSGAGDLTFSAGVTGPHQLSMSLGGSGDFTAHDIDVGGLSFVDGNSLSLGGDITTDTALDFTGLARITLTDNLTIAATDGSTRQDLTFSGANLIDGAYALTLTGDTVTVDRVGSLAALTNLAVNADTAIVLNDTVATTGTQTYTAPTVGLSGDLTATNSNISFNNALTLNADTIINTGSGAGDITVGDTVNGSQALTLSAGTGAVSIGGAIGGSTRLSQLTATGNTIALNGALTVNDQIYNGATTVQGTFGNTGGDVIFNSPVTLAANTTLDTSGGGGNVTFTNTVDGGFDLDATTGTGQVSLQGVVGGVTPLNQINLSGNGVALNTITTVLGQSFSGALILNGDLTVNTGSVTLSGNVNLGGDSIITSGLLSGDNITITGSMAGDNTLTLAAGLGDLILNGIDIDTLTLTSGADLNASGNIITDSALDFTNIGALTLTTDATLAAFDGTIASDILLDSANVINGSGNLTMQGRNIGLYNVSGISDLDITSQDGGAITLNSAITTAGSQTYTGPVTAHGNLAASNANITVNDALTLAADQVINSGGGNITLAGATDGAQALTLNAGSGAVNVTSVVGGSTPVTQFSATGNTVALANVTTTGDLATTGITTFNGVATSGGNVTVTGDSTINSGGRVTAGGAMTLGGALALADSTTLTAGGSVGDDVTVSGDITGAYGLTIDAGLADVSLGGNIDIGSLGFTSGGALTLGGSTYTADTGLDFSNLVGNVTLTGNTALNGTDGTNRSDVTFGPNNTILGPYDLAVYGDTVTLYDVGDNGGANDLLSLNVDSTITNLSGAVYTVNAQNYTSIDGLANSLVTQGSDITIASPLTLLGGVTLSTGAGLGDINISGSVNGAFDFTLDAGLGSVMTTADFGVVSPLDNVVINGSSISIANIISTSGNQTYNGPTTLNGHLTTTGGDILFNDTVILVGDTQLTTGTIINGDITFNEAVNSPYDLTLAAGTGNILFVEAVGDTTRLGDFTVTGANDVAFQKGIIASSYTQNSGTGDVNFGTTPGLDVTGDIHITGVQNISGNLTGQDAVLNPTGSTNVQVEVDSLLLGGNQTNIQGLIAGRAGRDAAREIRYITFTGGPHHMNGYTLPLLGDFAAPQTFTTTALADFDTPSGAALDYTANEQLVMNPFTERYALFENASENLVENTVATTPFWEVYLDDETIMTLN